MCLCVCAGVWGLCYAWREVACVWVFVCVCVLGCVCVHVYVSVDGVFACIVCVPGYVQGRVWMCVHVGVGVCGGVVCGCVSWCVCLGVCGVAFGGTLEGGGTPGDPHTHTHWSQVTVLS